MSDDLLVKEKEFHRLNQDLYIKTCDMMKTVDSIIQAYARENLFSNTNQLFPNLMIEDGKTMHSEDVAPKINKQLKTLIKVSEIPSVEYTQSLKKDNNMENKTIITVLKNKIDMLYKKLQVMQLEYDNKN